MGNEYAQGISFALLAGTPGTRASGQQGPCATAESVHRLEALSALSLISQGAREKAAWIYGDTKTTYAHRAHPGISV